MSTTRKHLDVWLGIVIGTSLYFGCKALLGFGNMEDIKSGFDLIFYSSAALVLHRTLH